MKDPAVQILVDDLKNSVAHVNALMAELQNHSVEVRIEYRDRKGDEPQRINLWRVQQNNDYL
jgi:hypothetical protein